MASAPTSSLRYRNRSGEIKAAPEEWTPGYVEVCVEAGEWDEVSLLRNESPLPLSLTKLAGEVCVVAEWPRSGAGHYRLTLEREGQKASQTWTVAPKKLSPNAYQALFVELDALPVSIAIALQKLGALAGLKLLAPSASTVAQELLRLERAVDGTETRPGLAQVLNAVAPDPHAILRSSAPSVPLDQARRVHPTELVRAYTRGHNLDSAGRPLRIVDTRVEHTVDVYENRLLRLFHDELARRIRRLARRLEARGPDDASAAETRRLEQVLRRSRIQASFLDQVGLPRQLPSRLTMVLLRRPEYRAALEGFLEFRRSTTVRLEEPALDAPLTELPHLYETWGVMHLIRALAEAGAKTGYRAELERLVYRDGSGTYVQLLRDGRPALVLRNDTLGRTVRLIPQRRYSPNGRHLHSASYEQRPDVAIEIHNDAGPLEVLLFDPKYKLDSEDADGAITDARPQKTDVDKMHSYRDAIRDQDDERVVSLAAILYPGPKAPSFGTGVAALSATPEASDELAAELDTLLCSVLAPTDAALTAA